MFVYFNPDVMKSPVKATLTNIRAADLDNKMTQFRTKLIPPYKSREDAIADDIGSAVFFYEDGILYEADRIATFQYRPCLKVECNYGINWHTYYAKTIDALAAYVRTAYGKALDVVPQLNSQGLYEVQIHIDGRCR